MIELEKTGRDKKEIHIKKRKGKNVSHPMIEVVQSNFYDELKRVEVEDYKLSFDQIVDEIARQGEKFAKNPTFKELKIYKSMIKKFLEYVSKNMVQIEHHTGGRMRQKIYTVTHVIDEKLKLLTEFVLGGQIKNINLLAKLDEIRGLLVDIYR